MARVSKRNPYHDERGRFTSANAAVGGAGVRGGRGKKPRVRRGNETKSKSGESKTVQELKNAGVPDFAIEGILAEARQHDSPQSFRVAFSVQKMQGTYTHLTSEKDFKVDINRKTYGGSEGFSTEPAINLSGDPENWKAVFREEIQGWEHKTREEKKAMLSGKGKYLAIVTMPNAPQGSYQNTTGYDGHKIYVGSKGLPHVVVHKVMPYQQGVRYFNKIHNKVWDVLTGGDVVGGGNYGGKLEEIWEYANKTKVSKANPYHDERGRFTSANAAVGGSGGRSGRVRTIKPAPRKRGKKGGKRKADYKERIARIDEKIDELVESRNNLFDPMTERSIGGVVINRRTGKPAKGSTRLTESEKSAAAVKRKQAEYSRKMKALQDKRTEAMGDAARAAAKRQKKAETKQARDAAYLKRPRGKKSIEASRKFQERLRQKMFTSTEDRFRMMRAVANAPSELVFRQPKPPKRDKKRKRGWVGKVYVGDLELVAVPALSKNNPTSSDVHLPTIMNRKKKRTRKMMLEDIVEKNAKLKNPKGGLTAAGRRHFKRKEGANLKPGVKGKADTPEKMRRKGSFLTRFFTNPSGPMKNDKGEPTRLALSAAAWGEPVPRDRASAARLAAKGRSLLQRYENRKKVEKANPYHDERGRFTSANAAVGGAGMRTGRPGRGHGSSKQRKARHRAESNALNNKQQDRYHAARRDGVSHEKALVEAGGNPKAFAMARKHQKLISSNKPKTPEMQKAMDKVRSEYQRLDSASQSQYMTYRIMTDESPGGIKPFNIVAESAKQTDGTISVSGGRSKLSSKERRARRDQRNAEQRDAFDTLVSRTGQMKSRIEPKNARDKAKAKKVRDYMTPAAKRFKNPKHRAYALERIKQMTSGKARPDGMSKPYGMSAADVRTYEAVLGRIFKSGRLKYGI